MEFRRKDLLGIADLEPEEIQVILDTAASFKEISTRPIKKVPTLRGKTVVTMFYEPSTRTRMSFEIAAKRLSADTLNLTVSASSAVKGETLADTAHNLEAMAPDVLIIRHAASGAPHYLAQRLKCGVINAGDGLHEHPTQALLDLLTVKEAKGTLSGLKVAIIGDIAHSRVARSDIHAFTKMGSQVTVAGPATMLPPYLETLGATVTTSLLEAVRGADVIMMLRLQLERMGQMFLSTLREYSQFFGLAPKHLQLAKDDVIIMHPGPLNRGVEISPEVADGPHSLILEQVTNGVAVRMAVLYFLIGGEKG
ncbi:MAG: aspartate carbamoyltransferase catalytic subunit [Deltaproteobacteria bacterium]|nr:aspartate carbamoyltransferase catalytic subunit [Deltaproteobacteria bacterium]MBI4795624.1 aspartate carbamoyltransferase catalytic subunit [Deltaproteobacteria bacterium]